MGIKLDEFIKHSNNPTIVDEGEILSISEKLIHLKLSDLMATDGSTHGWFRTISKV